MQLINPNNTPIPDEVLKALFGGMAQSGDIKVQQVGTVVTEGGKVMSAPLIGRGMNVPAKSD